MRSWSLFDESPLDDLRDEAEEEVEREDPPLTVAPIIRETTSRHYARIAAELHRADREEKSRRGR